MLNFEGTNSSLIISFIGFNMIDKQQQKGKNASLKHRILTILVCFHINWLGSFLLYEAVMVGFDISTDGFMNMNGLVIATVTWMGIAAILLVISSYAKELLGSLYRTIRATQLVFLSIPIILLMVFLFVTSLK